MTRHNSKIDLISGIFFMIYRFKETRFKHGEVFRNLKRVFLLLALTHITCEAANNRQVNKLNVKPEAQAEALQQNGS
jgi:hypothetical protein